jgi:hypothetical protein
VAEALIYRRIAPAPAPSSTSGVDAPRARAFGW